MPTGRFGFLVVADSDDEDISGPSTRVRPESEAALPGGSRASEPQAVAAVAEIESTRDHAAADAASAGSRRSAVNREQISPVEPHDTLVPAREASRGSMVSSGARKLKSSTNGSAPIDRKALPVRDRVERKFTPSLPPGRGVRSTPSCSELYETKKTSHDGRLAMAKGDSHVQHHGLPLKDSSCMRPSELGGSISSPVAQDEALSPDPPAHERTSESPQKATGGSVRAGGCEPVSPCDNAAHEVEAVPSDSSVPTSHAVDVTQPRGGHESRDASGRGEDKVEVTPKEDPLEMAEPLGPYTFQSAGSCTITAVPQPAQPQPEKIKSRSLLCGCFVKKSTPAPLAATSSAKHFPRDSSGSDRGETAHQKPPTVVVTPVQGGTPPSPGSRELADAVATAPSGVASQESKVGLGSAHHMGTATPLEDVRASITMCEDILAQANVHATAVDRAAMEEIPPPCSANVAERMGDESCAAEVPDQEVQLAPEPREDHGYDADYDIRIIQEYLESVATASPDPLACTNISWPRSVGVSTPILCGRADCPFDDSGGYSTSIQDVSVPILTPQSEKDHRSRHSHSQSVHHVAVPAEVPQASATGTLSIGTGTASIAEPLGAADTITPAAKTSSVSSNRAQPPIATDSPANAASLFPPRLLQRHFILPSPQLTSATQEMQQDTKEKSSSFMDSKATSVRSSSFTSDGAWSPVTEDRLPHAGDVPVVASSKSASYHADPLAPMSSEKTCSAAQRKAAGDSRRKHFVRDPRSSLRDIACPAPCVVLTPPGRSVEGALNSSSGKARLPNAHGSPYTEIDETVRIPPDQEVQDSQQSFSHEATSGDPPARPTAGLWPPKAFKDKEPIYLEGGHRRPWASATPSLAAEWNKQPFGSRSRKLWLESSHVIRTPVSNGTDVGSSRSSSAASEGRAVAAPPRACTGSMNTSLQSTILITVKTPMAASLERKNTKRQNLQGARAQHLVTERSAARGLASLGWTQLSTLPSSSPFSSSFSSGPRSHDNSLRGAEANDEVLAKGASQIEFGVQDGGLLANDPKEASFSLLRSIETGSSSSNSSSAVLAVPLRTEAPKRVALGHRAPSSLRNTSERRTSRVSENREPIVDQQPHHLAAPLRRRALSESNGGLGPRPEARRLSQLNNQPRAEVLPAWKRRLLCESQEAERREMASAARVASDLTFHPKISPTIVRNGDVNTEPFHERLSKPRSSLPPQQREPSSKASPISGRRSPWHSIYPHPSETRPMTFDDVAAGMEKARRSSHHRLTRLSRDGAGAANIAAMTAHT